MIADQVEHSLGVVYRLRGNTPHWLIISARPTSSSSDISTQKGKISSDLESYWLVFIELPYNFFWRLLVALTTYISTIITIFMYTKMIDMVLLVIIQCILTVFFAMDFVMAVFNRIITHPVKVLLVKRSVAGLTVEAISLLPLSAMYMLIVRDYDRNTAFILSCIVLLRFYRVPQFFSEQSYAAGISHMKYTMLQISLYLFLSMTAFSIMWSESLRAIKFEDKDSETGKKYEQHLFITALYYAYMMFTNTGFGDVKATSVFEKIICIAAMLVGFVLITGILIGALTRDMLQREKPREKFRREYYATIRYMRGNRLGPNTVRKITKEIDLMWHYKGGLTDNKAKYLMPDSLRKDIAFDIVFGFLYRSILFANQDRTFLRSISTIMKNKTYLPGDEIVRPTGILHGMICVTSGVVEILSVENDSSPIISFTAGTVLGEISLFLAIPIKMIIRASTIVELQILYTLDFCRLAMKYTSNCSAMRADLLKRCRESRKILLNDAPKSLDPEEPAHVRLKALKSLIQNLKAPPDGEDEQLTPANAFKANIRNLYVITENLPMVKVVPMSILRNKPWIMRPDTTFTYTWDYFMFLVVTFVIYYYPYMAAFRRQLDSVGYMVLFTVELIYLVDLVKQCITAVPRDDSYSFKTEIKDIVLTRLTSYGFYLDVLSTYEFSVFSPLLNFSTYEHMILLVSLNKMLRIWIVPRFFIRLENQFARTLMLLRIAKYFYYVSWIIHFGATLLYMEACPAECHPNRWFGIFQAHEEGDDPYLFHPYVISVYLSVMLTSTTGYGNIVPATNADKATMMSLMTMGLIIFSFVISQLTATFKHIDGKRTNFQEEIHAIDRFLIEHKLPQRLRERMRRYFRVQWSYDRGTSFQKTMQLPELPNKLRTIMLNEKLTTLQSIPIFQNAHPGFMLELAKGCEVRVLPDNEMVVYAGSLDREMYILQSGYCTIYNKNTPDHLSVIGAYTSFGELEMVQGVPIVVDVKTLTHVKIISIEYSTYMRAVTKYPDVREHIELMMETNKFHANVTRIRPIAVTKKQADKVFRRKNILKRFLSGVVHSCINVYKYDKRNNRNYWEPFYSWNKLRFLRYLFIPVVVKPNSSVLHIWMTIRVANAIVVGFLAPIYFSMPSLMTKITGLILFVQIITWMDLYLTFHLAYYNSKGVLVFHPAKTVVHYLKGSFFFDLVISFPYFWVVEMSTRNDRPSLAYNGSGLIKVLQYYKFLQACNVYERDILRRSTSLKLLRYIPTILILTNLLAALLILIECEGLEDTEKISDNDSTHARYRDAIRQYCLAPQTGTVEMNLEMYLIAFYYITASMTYCGFGDVIPTNNTNVIASVFTVMFGIFVYGSMFASIASSKIFAYYNVTMYRTQLMEMMTFLGKGNVSEKLKRRIFMHYLQTWGRTFGYTPQKTLSNVHTVLKQDVVDWMYESTLRKVAVFNFVDKYFIRCVGKYIDEIYFLEGEEICKHNHIQDEMYIIYRGKIDILDADGNFVTSMGGGGLFGNMTDKPKALSGITAVAATNVELIRMKAEDFHKTLAIYPNVKKEIGRLTSQSPDYITPSTEIRYTTIDEMDEEILSFPDVYVQPGSNFPKSEKIKGKLCFRKSIYRLSGKSKMNFLIVSGSWLHSVLSLMTVAFSYISCIFITYVFAFQDYNFIVLILYIVPDLYFYLKIFLEFNYTYIDNKNDHICSRKFIIRKYVHSMRFYFDVFSSFPLEMFALVAPRSFPIGMSFLRLNRLLRIYYFIEYYKSGMRKLMVNIYFREIGTLVAWTSILIHCLACIWYICACPVMFCYEESWIKKAGMTGHRQHEKYITSVYYVVTIITTTGFGDIVSDNYYELCMSTLIMILSHFGLVLGAVTFLAMINVRNLTFVRYEECISQYRKDLIRQRISHYQLNKLWKYVQLLWLREMGKQMPVFVYSAPYVMKCDIYIALYGHHLERSYIFSGLDQTFQRQVAINMRRYIYFPGYYIVQQGDKDGTMYFIHRGDVSVMTIHTNFMETVHYHLKINDQFGIAQGLIFGEPHVFSYRAETEVEIISLRLRHWQHLLKHFPKIKPLIYARLGKIQNK